MSDASRTPAAERKSRAGYWAKYIQDREARDPEFKAKRRADSRKWKDRNRAYNRLRDRERLRAKQANNAVPASPFHRMTDSLDSNA